MKKLLLLLCLTLLLPSFAGAETKTYQFKSGNENGITDDQSGEWTNGAPGFSFSSNQIPGVYSGSSSTDRGLSTNITSSVTSNTIFNNVTKITVDASSNSTGNSLTVQVGGTQIGETYSLSKSNHQMIEFVSSTPLSGTITFSVTRSNKTVWIAGFQLTTAETSPDLQTAELAFEQEAYEFTLGESFVSPQLVKQVTDGAITYASSNVAVATVSAETGELILLSAGTTEITATSAATATYNAGKATYTLTVVDPNALLPAEISYTTTSFTVEEYDKTFTAPVLNNPNNLSPITYSSNNEESVMVDTDGSVMIFAAGTAEITATFAGNDEYEAATASYTITVKKPVVPGENVYQIVTSSDQLEAGAKYVIISKPFKSGAVNYGTYVMGAPKSTGKGFEAIKLNPDATQIEETYDLTEVASYSEIILSNSETEGEWYMMIGDQYIDGSTKSNATLGADKKSVSISFNDSYDAIIKTGMDGTKDIHLQMYAQNSNGKPANEAFNAYSSTQKKIALFKQVVKQTAPAVPTVMVNDVEITDFESNYNLNEQEVTVVLTAPEGHHVHHKYVVNNTAETPNQLRGITPEQGFTDNNAQTVTLKIKENGDLHFYSIHPETGAKSATTVLTFIGGTTSISEIGADEAAEAEWFDVQGRRVARPANGGVYILKQGSKVSKRIL